MKLELVFLAFFAVLVPNILAQVDPRMMLSLMGADVKLPPKPPKSLFPHLYRDPQQVRQRVLEQRRRQEMELYRRLKAMSQAELEAFQQKLSPQQLQQLVSRLKMLKSMEAQTASTSPAAADGPNMILSGANTIRRPAAGGSAAAVAAARRRLASRRPKNPLDGIRRYQSYRKKAMSAMAAGCTFPNGMDTMDSFFAFSRGGCRAGGAAICLISMKSCVDVGSSVMCCPPGYTSGTLDAMSYMKQMQQFMAQFS